MEIRAGKVRTACGDITHVKQIEDSEREFFWSGVLNGRMETWTKSGTFDPESNEAGFNDITANVDDDPAPDGPTITATHITIPLSQLNCPATHRVVDVRGLRDGELFIDSRGEVMMGSGEWRGPVVIVEKVEPPKPVMPDDSGSIEEWKRSVAFIVKDIHDRLHDIENAEVKE